MKEELQSKLVEILTSIQTATGKAADFAMDQLPDIAQSYVLYGRVSGLLITLVPGVLALALLWRLAWNFRNPQLDEYGLRNDSQTTVMFAQAVAGFVTAFTSMFEVKGTLLVWLAPKVWLLKELAGLVK